jgi:hypothetical protein
MSITLARALGAIVAWTLWTLLGIYIGVTVWMDLFAFAEAKCGTVMFSLTWPIFAFGGHTGLDAWGPYLWVEYHIAGFCVWYWPL